MKITDIKLTSSPDSAILSAMLDDFLLEYRFPPDFQLERRADAFVAAALVTSMYLGQDIQIEDDAPVSPLLLKNLDTLQDVYVLWGPQMHQNFKRIEISGGVVRAAGEAGDVSSGGTKVSDKTVSFFSGGVDGTYTFLRNAAAIDFLLFSRGIDMQLDNTGAFDEAFQLNKGYLDEFDKPLFSITTNVRYLSARHDLSWNYWLAGGLASIAMAGGFRRCLVASSLCYADMFPHGSTFATDHLWRNEHTEIIHDGAESTRLDKIRRLKESPKALEILRVCWQDRGYNCGECEKCLRTMVSLRLLDISTPSFPECTDQLIKEKVSRLRLYEDYDVAYLMENLQLARTRNDVVLIKALEKVLRDFELRKAMKLLDHAVLSGRMQKIKNALRRRK